MENKESSHFIKHESSPNTKHKRFFSNKLLPNKIPNKVGCIVNKSDSDIKSPVNKRNSQSIESNSNSRSASGTSSRPLSLHVSDNNKVSEQSVCDPVINSFNLKINILFL